MAKYKDEDTISRQAAIDALDEYIEEYSYDLDENGYHNPKWCAMQEAKMTIQRLSSVERRGRWEKTGVSRYAIDMRFTVYEWKCSCCGKRKWDAELPKENYCPNCGAKMEVE